MKHELLSLMNVGKATLNDLLLLGIDSIEKLALSDPDELYMQLHVITQTKHDPCVWDVFAAIIHEAKTGEKKPWWEYTAVRKKHFQTMENNHASD